MKKDFSGNLSQALDLPQETLSNAPLITLRGKGQLSIENHGGILSYSSECICVAAKKGNVIVHGCSLQIASMSKSCLCLRGKIRMVELE